MHQAVLFGDEAPSFDPGFSTARREALGQGAWLERVPGWVSGHTTLFEALHGSTAWRARRRMMYERMVDVPRLMARIPDDGPGHPILRQLARALSGRYGRPLYSISMGLYRDGRDSVAFHGDRLGALIDDTVVAILSLGGPRRFLLRPASGGRSLRMSVGWGDLAVMGGCCQRTWQHAIPKMAQAAPRIAVMFREREDEPEDEQFAGSS